MAALYRARYRAQLGVGTIQRSGGPIIMDFRKQRQHRGYQLPRGLPSRYVLFFSIGLLYFSVWHGIILMQLLHHRTHSAESLEVQHDARQNDAAQPPVVDYTYGTIIAGRNTAHAYRSLDSVEFENGAMNKNTDVNGIRICMFTDEYGGIYPSGGIGYVVAETAALLAANGADVTIAYLGDGIAEELMLKKLQNQSISFVNVPESLVPASPNHVTLTRSYKALLHLMADGLHFDIIHFNDYFGHALLPLYAKRQGWLLAETKVVITLHGVTSWARAANRKLPSTVDDISVDWFETEAVSNADYILAPSKFIAKFLVSRGVVLPRRVTVLPNAPPEMDLQPLEHKIAEGSQSEYVTEIVFFGRLEYRKGPTLLVDALALLAKKYPAILVSSIHCFDVHPVPNAFSVNRVELLSRLWGETLLSTISLHR